MNLAEVFLGLGEDSFAELIRSVSIGKLRTYQLFDQVKARARVTKLNSDGLRKAIPRLWARLQEKEEDYAKDLAQAILVSHLEMVRRVLDFLGIPNEEGFFSKNLDASPYLTEGWQDRVWNEFKDILPRTPLLFYLNHLGWELAGQEELYRPV